MQRFKSANDRCYFSIKEKTRITLLWRRWRGSQIHFIAKVISKGLDVPGYLSTEDLGCK